MVQANKLLSFKNLEHYFFNKKDEAGPLFKKISKLSVDCSQTHSSKIVEINYRPKRAYKADAMVTRNKLYLSIVTADCLPVFFYDSKEKIVAAVHAGWRGLKAGIISRTINKITEMGGSLESTTACIGPHIGVCCYNVDEERRNMFRELGYLNNDIFIKKSSAWFFDMAKLAEVQMTIARLKQKCIEIIDICTSCNTDYASFRRDGPDCGRILSSIGLVS